LGAGHLAVATDAGTGIDGSVSAGPVPGTTDRGRADHHDQSGDQPVARAEARKRRAHGALGCTRHAPSWPPTCAHPAAVNLRAGVVVAVTYAGHAPDRPPPPGFHHRICPRQTPAPWGPATGEP